MIKIILKASKVSKRNMNKSLSIVKKFMKIELGPKCNS